MRWIEFTATGSDFESGFLLYRALRSAFPKTYSDRLRLRFAPLLKLHMDNEYPRASITTRLGRPAENRFITVLSRHAPRRKNLPTILSISSRCAAAWTTFTLTPLSRAASIQR